MNGPIDVGLLDPLTGDVAQLVGDEAHLRGMVAVEQALLEAFVEAGGLPASVADGFRGAARTLDLPALAAAGRAGGNAVIPLLAALRPRLPAESAKWLHFGATSQDIVDTAAMLVARDVLEAICAPLDALVVSLSALADSARHTPVAGRTLGQHAAPTTFGLRVAVLLDGIVCARRRLDSVALPAQIGGSVGTMAVLADAIGEQPAAAVRTAFAARLGLTDRPSVWHVERTPVADLGAALALLIGALGRLGLEVAHLASTEIGEVTIEQGDGDGGSSAMPQKRNPVAAVLLVGAARRSPALAATLFAAQLALDDRPSGDWHAEWQPLRELLRLAAESAVAAADLAASLRPDAARMRANIDLSHGAIHAERAQRVLAAAIGSKPAAALVRAALSDDDDFVTALIARVAGDPAAADSSVADAVIARIREVTTLDGHVGLSDVFIDAGLAAARSAE